MLKFRINVNGMCLLLIKLSFQVKVYGYFSNLQLPFKAMF
jgi:hypothetical protein